MKRSNIIAYFFLQAFIATTTTALVTQRQTIKGSPRGDSKAIHSQSRNSPDNDDESLSASRREILQRAVTVTLLSTPLTLLSPGSAMAAAEQRCDAEDIRCQQDGKLGDAPSGQPIPCCRYVCMAPLRQPVADCGPATQPYQGDVHPRGVALSRGACA